MRFFIITSIIFSAAIILCGCKHHEKILTEKEIYNIELQEIYAQQFSLRRAKLLQSLRIENSKAATLSDISDLELMLDDYELSEIEKNKNILRYFEHALLYMQILIFPEKRETFLRENIKNNLTHEFSSLFLYRTNAQNFLIAALHEPDSISVQNIRKFYSEMLDNQQIGYTALRISDLTATRKIPDLNYPLHTVPPFKNANELLKIKFPDSDISDAAMEFFSGLSSQHNEKFPLQLLKILYKAPHEINSFYDKDKELKKDFCNLLLYITHIYISNQLFNDMQNTFIIYQEMQNSISDKTPITAEMADALTRSRIAYELAVLKCLTYAGLTPFDKITTPKTISPQLPASRINTLKLIFNDIK